MTDHDDPRDGGGGERVEEIEGVVRAQWPSGLYQVEIGGGHLVVAHPGGGPRRNFVRLLVGDRVALVLAPRDLTRGRIVKRLVGHGS